MRKYPNGIPNKMDRYKLATDLYYWENATKVPIGGSQDAFGSVYGMMMAIIAWIALPFFWIPVLKNVIREMDATEKIFSDRLERLKNC